MNNFNVSIQHTIQIKMFMVNSNFNSCYWKENYFSTRSSSLASSKPCIYTFIFFPFLMMTINVKQTLFSIIETCMIHILSLFDNENLYQANYFRHNQNLKLAWFTSYLIRYYWKVYYYETILLLQCEFFFSIVKRG